MDRFGTGATQAIMKWWGEQHRDVFGTGKNGFEEFLGTLKLTFFFIPMLASVIIMGIIDSFVEFFEWVAGGLNETDDDQARDFINSHSCQQINMLSDDKMVSMINSMLDGPTGDDDENAILKLLGCLSCNRMQTIVNRVGLGNLQSDINGSEFDELQVLLGNCGIIKFSDWDDDASRLFIGRASCAQLNSLSAQAIHQLFINLIAGSCGDDDEQAINKVMGCIDCSKIHQVLNMSGTRWDDFDSAIQGSEWKDFKTILSSRCGISG